MFCFPLLMNIYLSLMFTLPIARSTVARQDKRESGNSILLGVAMYLVSTLTLDALPCFLYISPVTAVV